MSKTKPTLGHLALLLDLSEASKITRNTARYLVEQSGRAGELAELVERAGISGAGAELRAVRARDAYARIRKRWVCTLSDVFGSWWPIHVDLPIVLRLARHSQTPLAKEIGGSLEQLIEQIAWQLEIDVLFFEKDDVPELLADTARLCQAVPTWRYSREVLGRPANPRHTLSCCGVLRASGAPANTLGFVEALIRLEIAEDRKQLAERKENAP